MHALLARDAIDDARDVMKNALELLLERPPLRLIAVLLEQNLCMQQVRGVREVWDGRAAAVLLCCCAAVCC